MNLVHAENYVNVQHISVIWVFKETLWEKEKICKYYTTKAQYWL